MCSCAGCVLPKSTWPKNICELKCNPVHMYSLTRRALLSHYHKEAIKTGVSPEAVEDRGKILQAALINLDFTLSIMGNIGRVFLHTTLNCLGEQRQ